MNKLTQLIRSSYATFQVFPLSSLKFLIMKIQFFTILFLFFSNGLLAQKYKSQIEINPYVRIDWYPEFSSPLDPVYTSYLTIRGESWGLNISYKREIKNSIFVKGGIGYYKYSFNHINNHLKQYNSSFGKGNQRLLDYVGPLYDYNTPGYWYNTITAITGFEKLFIVKNGMQISTGIDIKNYFTFNQRYKERSIDDGLYRLNNNRYFGISAILNGAILKKIGRLTIGPSLGLSIFDLWRKDKVFPNEKNHENRTKWFRGIGFGISCNYSLSKK